MIAIRVTTDLGPTSKVTGVDKSYARTSYAGRRPVDRPGRPKLAGETKRPTYGTTHASGGVQLIASILRPPHWKCHVTSPERRSVT